MVSVSRYCVVVLPELDPVVSHCSLGEALSFQRGYHEVIDSAEREAVIALEAQASAEGSPGRGVASVHRTHSAKSLQVACALRKA